MVRLYREDTYNMLWNVPALCNNDKAMVLLLEILDKMNANITIDSVYGSPRTVWNSGRPSMWRNVVSTEDLFNLVSLYNEFGVACCFTFNNYNITEKDLSDEQGNNICQILTQVPHVNYVIVSSDLLADYIKKNYPSIKIICSVIKPIYEHSEDGLDDALYYNKLLHEYDRVVLRSEKCMTNSLIHKLEYADKVEILVNQFCRPNCPRATEHYNYYEQYERTNKLDQSIAFCNQSCRSIEDHMLMDINRIRELRTYGINHFKLQGRNLSPLEFLHMLGNYVFEPTGKFQAIQDIILKSIQS